MPARIILAAAAGAATGALATAFFLNSRPATGGFHPTPVTIPRSPPVGATAPAPSPGATAKPEILLTLVDGPKLLVDPAGIFKYGKHTKQHHCQV